MSLVQNLPTIKPTERGTSAPHFRGPRNKISCCLVLQEKQKEAPAIRNQMETQFQQEAPAIQMETEDTISDPPIVEGGGDSRLLISIGHWLNELQPQVLVAATKGAAFL